MAEGAVWGLKGVWWDGVLWTGTHCHWMSLSLCGTLCAGRVAGGGDGSHAEHPEGGGMAPGQQLPDCASCQATQGRAIFELPVIVLFQFCVFFFFQINFWSLSPDLFLYSLRQVWGWFLQLSAACRRQQIAKESDALF